MTVKARAHARELGGLADFSIDRLDETKAAKLEPVAVVDIGSNSVRMVAYDGLRRAPAPIFNEKITAGLGRGVAASGRLPEEGVARTLRQLRRFAHLARTMRVKNVHAIATAAVRDAADGPDFVRRAEAALGAPIRVLSGEEEAKYTALGVISGIPEADGVVGDLGGGSLELVRVKEGRVKSGDTLPLGALRLAEEGGGDVVRMQAIVDGRLAGHKLVKKLEGRVLYAVGGAWRNLARLHMHWNGYPLSVVQQYTIPRHELLRLTEKLVSMPAGELSGLGVISERRAPLIAAAALVLGRLVELSGARAVVFSALGVREGLLFERLPKDVRETDPLLSATWDFARRYSRSPRHELELCAWSDNIAVEGGLECTRRWKRLRYAACMLADIGWRAHPDFRGSRALNLVAQGNFHGLDHYSRAFLALTVFFRYRGVGAKPPVDIAALVDDKGLKRARTLAALFRLAYALSAAMPGALPRIPLLVKPKKLVLELAGENADLAGEVVEKRLEQLARLLDREPVVKTVSG
jgi:exopolyphosphatase/guanosine-5'-triphosphate,3'-diphosphate pyrophosphatase